MPVPWKPNKRRRHKTRYVPTRQEQETKARSLHFQRHEQASALQETIRKNAGDILHEIPTFIRELKNWVAYGRESQGKCHIPTAGRDIEWAFHSQITRVPEVWIRAPTGVSADVSDGDVSST